MFCQVHLINIYFTPKFSYWVFYTHITNQCCDILYCSSFLVYRLCRRTSAQVISNGGGSLYVAGTCASLSDTKSDCVLLDERLRYCDKCFMSGKQGMRTGCGSRSQWCKRISVLSASFPNASLFFFTSVICILSIHHVVTQPCKYVWSFSCCFHTWGPPRFRTEEAAG